MQRAAGCNGTNVPTPLDAYSRHSQPPIVQRPIEIRFAGFLEPSPAPQSPRDHLRTLPRLEPGCLACRLSSLVAHHEEPRLDKVVSRFRAALVAIARPP